MTHECDNCIHNNDGWCSYFNEGREEAYLIDCPCKVEASTEGEDKT